MRNENDSNPPYKHVNESKAGNCFVGRHESQSKLSALKNTMSRVAVERAILTPACTSTFSQHAKARQRALEQCRHPCLRRRHSKSPFGTSYGEVRKINDDLRCHCGSLPIPAGRIKTRAIHFVRL